MWPFNKKASSVPGGVEEVLSAKPRKVWKLPKIVASRLIALLMWIAFVATAVVLFIGYRNVPMNYVISFVFLVVALATSIWRGTGEK